MRYTSFPELKYKLVSQKKWANWTENCAEEAGSSSTVTQYTTQVCEAVAEQNGKPFWYQMCPVALMANGTDGLSWRNYWLLYTKYYIESKRVTS